MPQRKSTTLIAITVIGLVTATLVFAQIDNDGSTQPPTSLAVNLDNAIISRTQIIELDGMVGMFDTATGELFEFQGQLTGRNARGSFLRVAPPVSGDTSGFLQIQKSGGATFLVDVVTGQIWLLRVRGDSARWISINVQ